MERLLLRRLQVHLLHLVGMDDDGGHGHRHPPASPETRCILHPGPLALRLIEEGVLVRTLESAGGLLPDSTGHLFYFFKRNGGYDTTHTCNVTREGVSCFFRVTGGFLLLKGGGMDNWGLGKRAERMDGAICLVGGFFKVELLWL